MAQDNEPTTNEKEEPTVAANGDAIAYRFVPRNPGDYLIGVPQRDLTQAEFDALAPEAKRNAVYEIPAVKATKDSPGHPGVPAMYQKVDKK